MSKREWGEGVMIIGEEIVIVGRVMRGGSTQIEKDSTRPMGVHCRGDANCGEGKDQSMGT